MSEVNVYLDVDGVINAVAANRPSWGWEGEQGVVSINKFSIRYSLDLVAALNALADRPGVHMHWLTTWEEDAPNDLCPAIGLRGQDWPVLHNHPRHEPTSDAWWKLHALREHLPDDRRAVWIDDDITWATDAREWLRFNPSVRWVSPHVQTGITRKQMRQIEDLTTTPARPHDAQTATTEGPTT